MSLGTLSRRDVFHSRSRSTSTTLRSRRSGIRIDVRLALRVDDLEIVLARGGGSSRLRK
jgi:hypothetical protein